MKTSPWVMASYALIIVIGALVALPNLLTPPQLSAWPSFLPQRQITLGLDLQGGSHLVLEIDRDALKADRLQSLADEVGDLVRQAGLGSASVRIAQGEVVVAPRSADETEAARAALADVVRPDPGIGTGPAEIALTVEGATLRLSPTDAGLDARVAAAAERSLEVIRQRVDQVGVSEPTIQRIGSDRILVQLPGLQDPTRLRQLLGSTAKMTFHMVANVDPGDPLPRGVHRLPDAKTSATYAVEDRVALDGEHLKDAHAAFDQRTKEPIITFRFDAVGARAFGEITSRNVGRPFAIVLDGKVLSAPVIREPITGGSGQIRGNFTVGETTVLAALLRSGSLPAPLTVIEERTVGPDLGADVIRMGVEAGAIGLAAVIGFMVLLYGGWGVIASGALVLNLVLTFAALTLFGATLTLPGIAGIILGIGIAVDANVLVNERIKEEARKGQRALASIDRGFRQAFATIVDANVTTLIATALLFMFGSGPVRGFAITMMIGIAVSMFTAVTVVRLVMTEWVARRRIKTIEMKPLLPLIPEKTSLSFMRARFLGIGLSLLISLASIGLFVTPGLNYGIDFTGGIQVEITTPHEADLARLRSDLGELGLGEVALQTVGDAHSVLIRVPQQPGGEQAQTAAVNALRAAVDRIDPGTTIDRTEVVGPKVSGELAWSGVLAVMLAGVGMLGYIWWRFEWNFAIGAIATLVLDTTKMVGFFALTGLDFNLTAIAALLTIIGYSVNDKVVVYDRMRENMRLYKKMPMRQLIDMSINQTLARCILTSSTTLLAILPMALMGGHSTDSFSLPMVAGIFLATTSSIFIAAPILLFLGEWWRRKSAERGAGREPSLPVPTA